MVTSTKELLIRYQNYRSPKMKIKREVEKGTYVRLTQGLYETDPGTEGFLLASYLVSPSYLSFEYVLSRKGLIPERVTVYTCATTLKNHTKEYANAFGRYSFRDVPVGVFAFGVKPYVENDYHYLMASPEKALCDLLYVKPPVSSIQALKELLFADLRVDEMEFQKLDKEDLIFLSNHYSKKNLTYLRQYLERR